MSPSFARAWAELGKIGPFRHNPLAHSSPLRVAAFAFVADYLLTPSPSRRLGHCLSGRFAGDPGAVHGRAIGCPNVALEHWLMSDENPI